MIIEDQAAVVDFLASPSTHGGSCVERIDTHASVVCLAGDRAFKLKRAVRFDYLDFSTAELRHGCCEAELRLNRRTAPTLYRGVVAVTREEDGSYALDGKGTPVDWVVEMNRFPQEALFDRLAATGNLALELMSSLAAAIADFHLSAERRLDAGGKAGMSWVIEGNAAGFAEFGRGCLEPWESYRVTDASCRELDRRADLLERRRADGYVRQCHGDLHLRNIVLLNGRPTLFDGVEFNDDISCIDVLYDLAFLLMDLWRRKLPRHANAVWNRYLSETADLDGLPLLPLFLSCRAAVRAKTSATAAQLRQTGSGGTNFRRWPASIWRWPTGSCIRRVAASSPLGASRDRGNRRSPRRSRLESVRCLGRWSSGAMRHGNVSAGSRSWSGSGRRISSHVSQRVYTTLAERAALVVQSGHSAVVDAVYARPADRQAIEQVAAAAAIPFIGLWLEAPEPVLMARTAQRRNDPSDADANVIRLQTAHDTGNMTWCRLDASVAEAALLSSATACVRERLHDALNVDANEAG